ncbi:MAG: DUF4234 domain-containing protein [Anaeroplasmataceae bacterium]|nr:DUF4234 domain-containing protein [Anaeroplasmataceae bacterium]
MTKRSVAAVVLLSIFTCGIYTIYWFYVTANELNNEKPEEELTNYIIAILLSLVTCGIYMIYWLYKFYSKVDSVTGKQNAIVNLIINFFLTPIVPMAIVQSSINDYVEKGE